MTENIISFDIRGAAFKIHNTLGPGLFESVYEAALAYELEKMGHYVQCQKGIPMNYDEISFDMGFRLDILVDDLVIIEVKSVESLLYVHHKQLLTYLALTNKKLGLLINFNSHSLTNSIVRIVNNL
jgi:GxxExxY protein